MPNNVSRSTVTRPSRPSVARKAKASGTPAKFEATPEKVSVAERIQLGRPPRTMAMAMASPTKRAEQRRGEADLDRDPVGGDDRRLRQRRDVLERELARIVLERAQHQIERGQDQEHHGEDEERRDAQPLRRQPHAARFRRRGIPATAAISETADVGHAPATVSEKVRAASRPPGLDPCHLTERWRRRRRPSSW